MKNAELLEELQHVYAERFGLTILITDENGERVSTITGDNALCGHLLEHGDLWCHIQEAAVWDWEITKPAFYDILPGIYFLIIPINDRNGSDYLIWAGVMVEEGTHALTKEQLKKRYGPDADWEKLLTAIPVIQPENKDWWIHRSAKLSRLGQALLQGASEEDSLAWQYPLLQQGIGTGVTDMEELFHLFLEKRDDYEFIGLAEAQEEEQYSITHVAGREMEGLRGALFAPGEGFLGRIAITKEAAYWEDIEKNPRAFFFHRRHSYPKTMSCFPIQRYDGTTAVLFGGSLSDTKVSKQMMETGQFMASMLEAGLYTDDLQQENMHQVNRLSSLIEICKLMAATPDVKRILYILVDISLNLVEGPFTTVILKDPDNDRVQLVSRGEIPASMEDYVQEVIKRHYKSRTVTAAQLYDAKWRTTVIECPLYYKEELLGVLCVGAGDTTEQQLKEHQTFLDTLAIIGATSLQLAKQEQASETAAGQAEALYRAIGQFDAEAFAKAETTAALAGDFSHKIGLPAPLVKDIIAACQLSCYSPGFLKDMLPDSKVPDIVEEGKNLLQSGGNIAWDDASIGSQVVALAIAQETNEGAWHADLTSEQGIVEEFHSFVKERQVSEQEFTLQEEGSSTPELMVADHAVKEQMSLSPREQEVLELVIQGLNNKEIAEELYISGHTVKNHVTKIFQKLDVPDRAHAISKVYQLKYQHSNR
ncbi:LuxR C-terminal-related transcriptional regulator [Thalassobacillus devorans]|uniref:LuxR C-terminal-related transcriptional regulator n=1 Tax=Thalassobacillus devorans TaxID=279813 RepID=UPI001C38EB88|nr:LuxR C-terminal-related transcriptional regulator [Thalassobacillus devorans]